MSSTILDVIKILEQAKLHFLIERTRPDTIRFSVTLVGERIEIDVFEDGHIEISRFYGDESVKGGKGLLIEILSRSMGD